jgi:putative membrane protein insertion efficiency factor
VSDAVSVRPVSEVERVVRATSAADATPRLSLRAPLASLLRLPILGYRYSLSMLIGRRCRFAPTCSEFADEALARHGAWAGGWMAAGRVCRCQPWGSDGYDPVPRALPSDAAWSRPWRYGRRTNTPVCEVVSDR